MKLLIFFKEKQKMSHSTNIGVSIIEIILVFVIGIVTMIYDEIIVINKCGLDKNVRNSIDKRGIEDTCLTRLNTTYEEEMKDINSNSINNDEFSF